MDRLDYQFFGRNLRACAAAMLTSAPLVLLAAPPDEVKALMEAGKPAEAYALGKQSPESLGDPAFDFFFGVAAIDAALIIQNSTQPQRKPAHRPSPSRRNT